MTKYTRRSFVRRTGSATLGAALGLGLLPSLTRKLHAADTSGGGEGVKGTWKVENLKVVNSGPQSYQLPGGAGTVTMEVQNWMIPENECRSLVTASQRFTITVVTVVEGTPRTFTKTWTRVREYRCNTGKVVMSDMDGMPKQILFPATATPANAIVTVDLTTQAPPPPPPGAPTESNPSDPTVSATVTKGPHSGTWAFAGALTPVAVCC